MPDLKTNRFDPNSGRGLALVQYNAKAGESDEQALRAIGNAMDAYTGVHHKATASRDRFESIDPNISVRNGFARQDYEYFRPNEAVPKTQKGAIAYCMEAYRKIGIVRNVVDLMSDFGSQGIHLVHPNPRIQKEYKKWFDAVGGPERSERFLNHLYRAGNVICKRSMAKLGPKHKAILMAMAQDEKLSADIDIDAILVPEKRVIPWRYHFLNPNNVEIAGGELAQFVGHQIYVYRVTYKLRRMIEAPQDQYERELVAMIPADIKAAVKAGAQFIKLPDEKLKVAHYKKDDWQEWADPMLYSILDDLILLEKHKLADLAALDGAISQIRIWTLGDMKEGIFPTNEAISKLSDILLSNPGGGAFDIIWGPDLKVDSLKTDVHQFLGKEKYEPCLESIYAGLGVPPTLTGSQNAAGMTNNYISLKTLVQRLEYGRMLLTNFWNEEIELVRKAMPYRLPAKVRFDRMVLSDEAAEKALLIQMWDRNLVSDETMLERFGEDENVELLRNRREKKERVRGSRPTKVGPYHIEDKEHELTKIALQRTLMSPNQAGIEVEEQFKKNPFIDQMDSQMQAAKMKGGPTKPAASKPKGRAGQGRPKNKKDSKPRTRTNKIRTGVGFLETLVWASSAQESINKIATPGLLKHYGKDNIRQLSAQQFDDMEHIKFALLANMEPFAEVNTESVYKVTTPDLTLASTFKYVYNEFYNNIVSKEHREPTIKELRMIQAATYALVKGELEPEPQGDSE
jgi:hypothetical protein